MNRDGLAARLETSRGCFQRVFARQQLREFILTRLIGRGFGDLRPSLELYACTGNSRRLAVRNCTPHSPGGTVSVLGISNGGKY